MRRVRARVRAAEVLATIRRVACIQLDSVSTVERSHRVALGARVGAYPEPSVSRLLRDGRAVRVLGARGVPAAGRGLPDAPLAHGAVRRRRIRGAATCSSASPS